MSGVDNHDGKATDPYVFDGFLIKEFLEAVKEGNQQKIQGYIERYSLDLKYIKDSNLNQNALFYATLIKDDTNALNIIKYFIELGVDPLFKDSIGQTALYYAAREGKYLCCKYLLEHGCPVNEKDLYQQTPVYYACREGRLDIVEMFIDAGSDLTIEDKFGQTCLFYAVREGHLPVVDFLLKKNVDVNKVDKKKQNPLSFAYKHNKPMIADLLISYGAIPVKEYFDRKSRMKKEEQNLEKQESIISNVKHKVVLIKIVDNGQKRPLTISEMAEFKKNYPEVYNILNDPVALEQIEKQSPDAVKVPDSWEKVAKKIINQLWKHKDAELFWKPVDPIDLGIPDYFDIIKVPMDFSTIKKKLNHSLYTKCKDFVDDLELTFNNCILYNGEKSLIGIMCNNVRSEYKKLAQQLNLDLYL